MVFIEYCYYTNKLSYTELLSASAGDLFCYVFFLGRGIGIKNSDLAEVWLESDKSNRKSAVFKKICSILKLTDCPDHLHKELTEECRLFCLTIGRKWEEVGRSRQGFLKRHEAWLQQKIQMSCTYPSSWRKLAKEQSQTKTWWKVSCWALKSKRKVTTNKYNRVNTDIQIYLKQAQEPSSSQEVNVSSDTVGVNSDEDTSDSD